MKRAMLLLALAGSAAQAQSMDHSGHDMSGHEGHAMPSQAMPSHAMPRHEGHDMGGHAMDPRQTSGTAWQPAASPMSGVHSSAGDWSLLAHGFANAIYADQGGSRGGDKVFSTSMAMLMASRPLSSSDTLQLRGMVSLDALMGKRGYPLLFATGETADGVETLVDRQHPHDFLMELSAMWTHDLGDGRSLSLYGGLPGEPALGPPVFMMRASGVTNPEAPIAHHWFDSTHITFGVATVGYATRTWKIEGSLFTGREPDQHRWDFDKPRFDSWSARLWWTPTENWAFQVSHGRLQSPEQLHPDEDERRTTASVSHTRRIGEDGHWATTLAWSAKDFQPGPTLHALLLESSVTLKARDTFFARAERVRQAELFHSPSPLAGTQSNVTRLSAGYARTLPLAGPVKLDLGGLVSAYAYPDRLEPAYGKEGVKSFMLFARVKL